MNKIVEKIGKINFEGNIIPANWYKHITFSSGKPNLNAIIILAEIVYWYRPTIIRDPATGEIKGYKTKFNADKLQRSYQSFADQFGISKRQAQDAIKLLRNLGLITLEFRTITMPTSGLKLTNVMFIEPVPERIEEITYNNIKEIDESNDNSVYYNTSYDRTKEVGREIVDTTTQRNTSYDRTEEVPTTNVGGQTPERETNTESTSQTTSETLLPDSVSLSSRSSDNKLVTRSKRSLQKSSLWCSDTKIDNLNTDNTPKDTVCILDNNKRDISLNKALDIEHIKHEISLKVPVIEPDISFKELDREPDKEPVNKPVLSTVTMLEDKTGKILNNNLNKPIDELDIEPEMSFDVPDSELDINIIESEEDAYAILVRDGFIDPSDPDDPFRDLLKNMPPHVEYTEEELEEILKKLNAGSSLNASCSEKKSNFERSGKILNNEQNKPKKDLFKPFSFDDFFGTSDNENLKVAPDISRVLASKKQNENSESETGKNLNNNLNKPEKDTNSVSDTPDNALSESFDFDDDLFELDDELFESEKHEAINAMPNPDDAPNASLETSHSDPDKEPETSLNAPEREPERNVIMPDADLIELENEPAGMDAEQTLQDSTDLQECLCAEDTDILTSAAEKDNCDTDSHVLHALDKADVNKDSCDAFLSDLSDDVVKILAKDKLSDADIKILEEAGFSVVGELDNTMQPDAKNVPEKHVDSTEQDFVKMLEEAFDAKVVDDVESNIVNDIEKPGIKPVDELDALPESLLSEPEKVANADKSDKMPAAESGRSFNEPDEVLVAEPDNELVSIADTDRKPDKVRKAKVISLADRRKSLRQADNLEKLPENALDRRISFANRHTNTLQKCLSCNNTHSLTTAVGKEKADELELAVNAGIRKRWKTVRGSPSVKANCIEIFKNLFAMSKQEHRKMTFACEGGT
ncbi:hypothetical protein [Thermoanaerobacterium thermosaccharolyticum]|uniref:hypothetical protein n=1 Tax=Thermoanaerobacterium thermosaccharolyticum TaxID=1517 RepID=UPI002FD8EE1A